MDNLGAQLVSSRAKFLGYIKKRIADPDLAEDILQDCFLKAVRSAPDIADSEKLTRWFYRILSNAIIDAYRRKASELSRRMDFAADPEILSDPNAEEEICECVNELIPTLKPEYAEVVKALDIQGEEAEDVSKRLGISRNNLKVRSHRARQALRKRLEETCRVCAEHHCVDCSCKK